MALLLLAIASMKSILRSARRIWTNYFAEPARYRGDYAGLERTYRWVEDPWAYGSSAYERVRFQWLLDLVCRLVPAGSRILEVGCGEGHFTRLLSEKGFRVTAVDVSATALERARSAAPAASFVHTALEDLEPSPGAFELVVASDMLYYLADPCRGLEILSRQAASRLVTYTLWEAVQLDGLFEELDLAGSDKFTFPWNLPTPWGSKAVWWSSLPMSDRCIR